MRKRWPSRPFGPAIRRRSRRWRSVIDARFELRAWRGREGFEDRALFRTWLYRIATNACLNALERAPQRVLPQDVAPPVAAQTPPSEARSAPSFAPDVPWLQPYPDQLLEPDALLSSRESIELAFLAALQHLPARQRATLILSHVVGWSAHEIAELLETSVAAVTSALQRGRATLQSRLPAGRQGWAPKAPISADERAVLERFMRAWGQGDAAQLTALLCDEARWAMPPAPLWFDGRAAIENLLRLFPPSFRGREFKMLATAANHQPAAAACLRTPADPVYRLSALHVLRVKAGHIADITTFSPGLCQGFGLPDTL